MERLRLLHGMLHMDEPQPFRFSWDWLAPSGLSVKDFIAPGAFEFKTGSRDVYKRQGGQQLAAGNHQPHGTGAGVQNEAGSVEASGKTGGFGG